MRDIFLDEKLKIYYMEDFENLLRSEKDFWKIDNKFLMAILKNINENSKVQTLYSKYGGRNLNGKKSYLQFTYARDVEDKIFRLILPELLLTYNYNFKSNCYYQYHEPYRNVNYNLNRESFGMKCVDDENYFMVNSIKIYLEANDEDIKQRFWKSVEVLLKELK
jgi:hypothetical protein